MLFSYLCTRFSKNPVIVGVQIRYTKNAFLLTEAEMERLVFDTPVPFYDVGVSCGSPTDVGNPLAITMLMPHELVGPYEMYCTRANGDSMKDLGIMTGDVLFMEGAREYHSGDIVMAEIDGETTLKTYYIDEKGRKWLVPANKKYKAIRLTPDMRIRFTGKLMYHMRCAPQESTKHIVEYIEEAEQVMEPQGVQTEGFKSLVVKPECADKVVARLRALSEDKLKPRDVMMPLRAAIEAGVLRRPTWVEYAAEFGFKRASKSTLSYYTDPTQNKFEDERQFWDLVEDFRRLVAL